MSANTRKFNTLEQVNDVVEILNSNLASYLDSPVPPPTIIAIGSDFVSSMYAKPYVLVPAISLDCEDDAQCMVEDTLTVSVGVYLEAPDDKTALEWIFQYCDAIRSVFLDNDRLEHSYDIKTTHADFYPGGSANEKLCIVELEMKQLITRG